MKKYVILFLFLAFIVSACSSDDDNPVDPKPKEYFPNSVGNEWVYDVYDSLEQTGYELNVKITDTYILEGLESMVWVYSGGAEVDSEYVQERNNVINVYFDEESLLKTIFKLPFEVGDKWSVATNSKFEDSMFVEGIETVTVPAGTFNNVYKIVEKWGGLNDYGQVEIWFFPEVGIIKRHEQNWGLFFKNEVRELKSFNVN